MKDRTINNRRIRDLIGRAIEIFSLNLHGLSVLTEAATGYYMLTPFIAAMANATRVYALTRDSQFGKAAEVYDQTMEMAVKLRIDERIEIFVERNDKRIGKADIVTNLGFVRPLDAPFLKSLKKYVVVPLMWETWEYRAEDLDLDECRKLGIPVLGTKESHPDLRIFEYIGHVAMKLLFEAGIEVFLSNIVILGTGEFAENTQRALLAAGARVDYIQTDENNTCKKDRLLESVEESDAIVVIDHHNKKEIIGPSGKVTSEELVSVNPGVTVVHICGAVDKTSLQKKGVKCWPEYFAPPGYMSVGTDYVGPRPLIYLHAAGLKVGEEMARARQKGLHGLEAERYTLKKLSFADGFVDHLEKVPS